MTEDDVIFDSTKMNKTPSVPPTKQSSGEGQHTVTLLHTYVQGSTGEKKQRFHLRARRGAQRR